MALIYDLHEAPIERFLFSRWRRRLWSRVSGNSVLEVGVGTGKNFPYQPRGSSVTGIDISERMMKRARRRNAKLGQDVDLLIMDAQHMALPSGSFDAAVATFVFCSVPDAVQGLREAHRALKPGGKAVFMEHVRSRNRLLAPLMDFFNPISVRLTGANINRDTVSNIERAGFVIESVTPLFSDIVLLIEARKADDENEASG